MMMKIKVVLFIESLDSIVREMKIIRLKRK